VCIRFIPIFQLYIITTKLPEAVAPGSYLFIEVVNMIERLMDMERSYGEPEYSKLSHQITQLRQALEQQLNQEGLADLERLTEAYIRQGNVLLSDGFAEGFWSAINLALEHYMQNHRI
jgi:hypothetical protein